MKSDDVLPDGWRKVKLGDVAEIQNGYAFKKQDFRDKHKKKLSDIPVIKIADVNRVKRDYEPEVFVNREKVDEKFIVNKDDFLVSLSGAYGFKPIVWDIDGCALNQRVCKIRIDEEKLDKYFFELLLTEKLEVFHGLAGGTSVQNLSTKDILQINSILPPLDVQKQIASQVEKLNSHVDSYVGALRDNLDALQSLRDGLVNELLPSGELTDEQLAQGWKRTELGNVCKIVAGFTPNKIEYAHAYGGDYPWLTIADMHNKYTDSSKDTLNQVGFELQPKKLIPANSILLSMYGSVGIVTINTAPLFTHQGILGITPLDNSIDIEFLAFLLQSSKDDLQRESKGSTQKNINKSIVSNFEIVLPPIEIQKQVAKQISDLDTQIENRKASLENAIEQTELLRSKLVQELLIGKACKE